MSWLSWLVVIMVVTVALRPLRRLFFRWATFIVPAFVGAVVGLLIAEHVLSGLSQPEPLARWLVPLLMFACGIGLGEHTHHWFKELDK